MSYRLSYLENFHFSNFQHPASEDANKFLQFFQPTIFLQDAAPGDSGAPLYTLGDSSASGEISNRYLLGIHSGGNGFSAVRLQRGNVFFPKWWIRVRVPTGRTVNDVVFLRMLQVQHA